MPIKFSFLLVINLKTTIIPSPVNTPIIKRDTSTLLCQLTFLYSPHANKRKPTNSNFSAHVIIKKQQQGCRRDYRNFNICREFGKSITFNNVGLYISLIDQFKNILKSSNTTPSNGKVKLSLIIGSPKIQAVTQINAMTSILDLYLYTPQT